MNINKATFIKLYNLVYHDNQGENEYKLYIQTGLEFFGDRFKAIIQAYEMGYNDCNADSKFYNGI